MSHAFADMNLQNLEGQPLATEAYAGKVLLIVNVASRCGLTPQYRGLVALHEEMVARGGSVVGVPCNQFGAQEPGTPDEIRTFCSTTYGVDFPLLAKQDVNGEGRSPLYRHLVGEGADIQWNFEKFLVDGNGAVLARFAPTVTPEDADLRAQVAAALS